MDRDSKCLAIAIKSQKVRDNDRLVNLLTSDRGILEVYVYGARKSVKSIKAPLYTEGVFSLYQKGENGKLSLKDIDIISIHDGFSDELDKTLAASLFSELVIKGRSPDERVYKLFTDALDSLEDSPADNVIAIFLLHYLYISGLSGDYRYCPICQREFKDGETLGFSFTEGVAVCSECDESSGEMILPFNARLYAARVLELSFSDALRLIISPEQIHRISRYLLRTLRHSFPSRLNALELF